MSDHESTVLRPLGTADGFLLRVATWLNVNWVEQRFTFAQVDADPHLAAYFRFVPERGDFGFVATLAGQPTGVVWASSFTVEAPGYGFVRTGVPEVSLCVLPGYRGVGLGGALLEAATAEGAAAGSAGSA
ncbi:GNAT family N-acetyltransferase [Blastococcus sp. PRF04-17]|uniref:GNAT family N-acetyltransferase n=1 Tax=Blastococcus sp. PRF04-17 TaxID=2933797 RepID=UPI001FF69BF7|nr:GNAT family N-acetyltransferase [Blastococcus sp. PRF04-17]UOY01293.1 GNAT family N-acetyltransferase [Blastococcus sp. PRF04-17]